LGILGLAVAGLTVLVTGVVVSAAGPAVYTFVGAPGAPLALAGPGAPGGAVLSRFDVQVHSRDRATWYALESMQAQHGADCGAPPATHENHTYEGAVFQCKDHMMTNIKAGGYGEIILTPDTMVDFSAGTATVSWDVSTFRQSGRDWWDVWLTPYDDNMPLPLQSWLPDLSGPPKNAVHVGLGLGSGMAVCPQVYRNFEEAPLVEGYGNGCKWWTGYETILNPSASVRTNFRIEVSQTHLKVWIPPQASTNNRSLVWFDGPIPGGLPFNKAVVQFGHHSYNPEKQDGCAPGATPCQAGTWHWNNISVSPGVAFTQIKAKQRYANAASPAVTFDAPAPANAYLRFSGHESAVQASFNGGAYQTVSERPTFKGNGPDGEFGQFFVPVPAGTQSVAFRVTPGWSGEWILKDFGIWAEGGTTTPATAIATAAAATPTATPTSVPPTTPPSVSSTTAPATATQKPATAPPTATPTAVPPTATPTAATPAVASWLTSASVSNASPTAGTRLLVSGFATSSSSVPALVDLEVYSPSGKRVYQKWYDNRAFSAGVTRTFSSYWTVPSSAEKGTYTLKVGVFKVGWAGLLLWNDSAVQFTVR